MSDLAKLIDQAREYELRGMDGIPVSEGPQVIALLAALADALAQPAPLTIDRANRGEVVRDIADELWKFRTNESGINDADREDVDYTEAYEVAETLADAVIAHLSEHDRQVEAEALRGAAYDWEETPDRTPRTGVDTGPWLRARAATIEQEGADRG